MTEFILPEKWCVKRTEENHKVINQWFIDNGHGEPWSDDNLITIVKSGYETGSNVKYFSYKDVKEITYEKFLKYVAKQKPQNINNTYPIY